MTFVVIKKFYAVSKTMAIVKSKHSDLMKKRRLWVNMQTSSSAGLTLHHVSVGVVRDRVDMGRDLMALFAFVHFNDLLRVDWQHFIGVHHHAKQPRVCLKKDNVSVFHCI